MVIGWGEMRCHLVVVRYFADISLAAWRQPARMTAVDAHLRSERFGRFRVQSKHWCRAAKVDCWPNADQIHDNIERNA